MWRHRFFAFVLLAGLFAQPGPARAKVLELWLQAQGGGMYGFYGTEKYDPANQVSPATDDFFKSHSGAAFGAQAGVELFFVDVILDFAQFADQNGLSGTLTCFMLGFDWDFQLSNRWEVTPFGNVGFALATYDNGWLKKEYPQIAKADLSARGLVARTGARLELKLHEMFRLGVEAGAGYHYMLQTDKASNDLEGHSHGFHGYVMALVRFQWEPFRRSKPKEPREPVILVAPQSRQAPAGVASRTPASSPSPRARPAATRQAPASRPMAPADPTGDATSQGGGQGKGPEDVQNSGQGRGQGGQETPIR